MHSRAGQAYCRLQFEENGHMSAVIRTCGRDAVVDAAKYVGGRLTAPVDGKGERTVEESKRSAREGVDKAKAHGHGLVDRAREAFDDAKHSVSESVEDVKQRVGETAEEYKQRAREAAQRARPRTTEVCLPSVLLPSVPVTAASSLQF